MNYFPEIPAVSRWTIFKAKLFGLRTTWEDSECFIETYHYKGVAYMTRLEMKLW